MAGRLGEHAPPGSVGLGGADFVTDSEWRENSMSRMKQTRRMTDEERNLRRVSQDNEQELSDSDLQKVEGGARKKATRKKATRKKARRKTF